MAQASTKSEQQDNGDRSPRHRDSGENGPRPVSLQVLQEFTQEFDVHGFRGKENRKDAMTPNELLKFPPFFFASLRHGGSLFLRICSNS